ncbi:hypothetical protein [Micromonospora sp. NPDC023737]|uniref:hypothetical protein n=1 Tax=unclassified Micromonospora TaxID=2617518 RepID=UPI0033E485E5
MQQGFGRTAELAGLRGWDFETCYGAVLLDNVRFLAGYRRPWPIDASLAVEAAWFGIADLTNGGEALSENVISLRAGTL